ncbi:hypothetical protein LTS18_009613, partial [Coniosporium uncinatum]
NRESNKAVDAGADEFDLVFDRRLLEQSDSYKTIYEKLSEQNKAIKDRSNKEAKTKIILESTELTKAQVVAVSCIAAFAGFDFVKTSTGFVPGGSATLEDVTTMKRVVGLIPGSSTSVKASGGIRDWTACRKMIEAGATRIGASAGVAIMKEIQEGKVKDEENQGAKESAGGY